MNYLKRNLEISIREMEKLKSNPLVEGVMFLGGVGRGFADVDSDIDIAVFSKDKLPNLPLGETTDDDNIDIEIYNIRLNDSCDSWSQVQKEAYAEGYIAFDRNGLVKEYISKALYYSDEEFELQYLIRLFHLAWHGLIYTKYKGKRIRGYKWILPSDLWYKRGNKENGFLILQQCALILIESLFVINRKWIPDFKWIWIKSLKLEYLPKNYEEKMSYILFEKFDDSTFPIKIQKFQELLDESFEKVEKILPENLYEIVRVYDYE